MKKLAILVGGLAIAAITLPSCKKEYQCVCRLNGNEVGRWDLGKQSREDAEDACNAKATKYRGYMGMLS